MKLPATLRYEKNGHVAVVTIDRPEAMNSLTREMLTGLDQAFAEFDADPELWVAILTGAGDRAFSAGMDLKEAIPLITSGDDVATVAQFLEPGATTYHAIDVIRRLLADVPAADAIKIQPNAEGPTAISA